MKAIQNEQELAAAHAEFDRLYDQFPNRIRGGPVSVRLDELAKAIDDWYAARGAATSHPPAGEGEEGVKSGGSAGGEMHSRRVEALTLCIRQAWAVAQWSDAASVWTTNELRARLTEVLEILNASHPDSAVNP